MAKVITDYNIADIGSNKYKSFEILLDKDWIYMYL